MTNGPANFSRREFAAMAAMALPGAAVLRAMATVDGVTIGAITYSFRSIPSAIDIVAAMKQIGLPEAEVMSNHIEQLSGAPVIARGAAREPLVEWRAAATPATFAAARKAFNDAGIDVRFLTYNMNKSTTPEEMDYAFRMAKGLGVRAITTSTQVSVAEKIAPLAGKYKMKVGFHGHDSTNPDEFATPESFAKAMALSPYHCVNLDIGHFTAAGFDAVAYIKEHHARITNLHLKDRKKDHGANVPWGQGDTPIKEVLQLLKKEQWDIPANIEFEYPGEAVPEVTKCYQFCKDALK
jgi:sugar phosphate isomerase/epimerase